MVNINWKPAFIFVDSASEPTVSLNNNNEIVTSYGTRGIGTIDYTYYRSGKIITDDPYTDPPGGDELLIQDKPTRETSVREGKPSIALTDNAEFLIFNEDGTGVTRTLSYIAGSSEGGILRFGPQHALSVVNLRLSPSVGLVSSTQAWVAGTDYEEQNIYVLELRSQTSNSTTPISKIWSPQGSPTLVSNGRDVSLVVNSQGVAVLAYKTAENGTDLFYRIGDVSSSISNWGQAVRIPNLPVSNDFSVSLRDDNIVIFATVDGSPIYQVGQINDNVIGWYMPQNQESGLNTVPSALYNAAPSSSVVSNLAMAVNAKGWVFLALTTVVPQSRTRRIFYSYGQLMF